MATEILTIFNDFRRILGICPCCGNLFRLSEVRLYYRVRPAKSWLDELEYWESKVNRTEDRFNERKAALKEEALVRANKRFARLMRRIDPVFSGRGYALEDARAVFDPVDFVLFDGMKRRGMVRKVIFMDGPAFNADRKRIQRAISKIISRRQFSWKTVRLSRDGDIQVL